MKVCEYCTKEYRPIRSRQKCCSLSCARLLRGRKPRAEMGGGYVGVFINGRYVKEHIAVAEQVLGRSLPKGAVVHHVDENTRNNAKNNLVICENNSYHRHLHTLLRVQKAGGRPHEDKICQACQYVKPKTEFYKNAAHYDGLNLECKPCANNRTGWAVRKAQGRI